MYWCFVPDCFVPDIDGRGVNLSHGYTARLLYYAIVPIDAVARKLCGMRPAALCALNIR